MDEFAALLGQPAVEGMLALGWGAFERFVGRVFARAGYGVEYVALRPGCGADLVLYAGGVVSGQPAAYVSVKHVKPPNVVVPAEVRAFGEALDELGAPGYLVAAVDLTQMARAEAERYTKLRVLAGRKWVEYVAGAGN